MVLECVNSAFSLVAAMHIWWDKFEFCVPLEGDGFFVCRAGLVVENLEVNQKTPGCQACHNCIVGCNAMAVTFGLECLLEDEIGWKAIMMYWFPEHALTGKWPVSSMYSLLRGCIVMKT